MDASVGSWGEGCRPPLCFRQEVARVQASGWDAQQQEISFGGME